MNLEEKFFWQLMNDAKSAFESSPISKYQKLKNKNWNYAVCETPIQKKKGVIFGLNWGGNDLDTQNEYPEKEKTRDWRFLTQSSKFFKEYLNIENVNEVNYSNLCFFRSPDLKYITWLDWYNSFPLFEKYLNFIQPPWVLSLGTTGIEILKEWELVQGTWIRNEFNNRAIYSYSSGKIFNKHLFFAVPHPQAQIANSLRHQAWKNCRIKDIISI